jgi:predicted dehydrogenase
VADGYLGELREVVVLGTNSDLADRDAPLHWRQDPELSGVNTLLLGILHETLIRWTPDPMRVTAVSQTFTPHRPHAESGEMVDVGVADSLHVISELPGGARGLYHLSGAIHFGPPPQIHLYGSEGTIKYEFAPEDRLWGAQRGHSRMTQMDAPPAEQGAWRVEADFIDAIRAGRQPKLTDFATGVRYMEFTEAVTASARERTPVKLPLARK